MKHVCLFTTIGLFGLLGTATAGPCDDAAGAWAKASDKARQCAADILVKRGFKVADPCKKASSKQKLSGCLAAIGAGPGDCKAVMSCFAGRKVTVNGETVSVSGSGSGKTVVRLDDGETVSVDSGRVAVDEQQASRPSSRRGNGPDRSGLKPMDPVQLLGNRNITIKGRLIKTEGSALEVLGNGHVLIEDSVLESEEVAIQMMGNGTITIRNSTIEGELHAIEFAGNGTIEASGTTFIGDIEKTGTGKLIDKGGNSYSED